MIFSLVFPSLTGYMLEFKEYYIDSSTTIGNVPEVLNSNRIFLNLNRSLVTSGQFFRFITWPLLYCPKSQYQTFKDALNP